MKFDVSAKQIFELEVDICSNFALGSNFIQMPPAAGNRLFIIGGYRQLHECFEIVQNKYDPQMMGLKNNYHIPLAREMRSRCDYERLHHSICIYRKNQFIVTGSLNEGACDKCEMYDIEKDKWTNLPQLKRGKQSHSSCAFNERYIYVFGAYQHGFLRNSIEVLDMD